MNELKQCPECGTEHQGTETEGLCPKCLLIHGLATETPAQLNEADSPLAGRTFTPPPAGELAGRFTQLEILELLGQGGMGAVYKARQPKLDRLVALKLLPPEAGRDSAFAERFAREARSLAKISHANIVAIHDFGESDGLFYFVMEFVDGVNLRQLLKAGRLKPVDALRIVSQVCDALQYAHEEGIVHRDIKPENILIDRKGRVKIADFGIAKLLGRETKSYTLTGPWQVVGTVNYMAPEQMDDPSRVDHRADIYSLGVVLYEMLTGEIPRGRFSLPSEKADVDARLDRIVLRAMEKEPEKRFQSLTDVKRAVQSVLRRRDPKERAVGGGAAISDWDLEMTRMRLTGPTVGLGLTILGGLTFWAVLGCVLFLGYLNGWFDPARLQPGRTIHTGLPVIPPVQPVVDKDHLIAASVGLTVAAGVLAILVSLVIPRLRKIPKFEGYGFALWASILSMLPWSPLVLIGLPVGLWSLVVLRDPKVQTVFVLHARRGRQTAEPSRIQLGSERAAKRQGPLRRKMKSFAWRMRSLVLNSSPPVITSSADPIAASEPVVQGAGGSPVSLLRSDSEFEMQPSSVVPGATRDYAPPRPISAPERSGRLMSFLCNPATWGVLFCATGIVAGFLPWVQRWGIPESVNVRQFHGTGTWEVTVAGIEAEPQGISLTLGLFATCFFGGTVVALIILAAGPGWPHFLRSILAVVAGIVLVVAIGNAISYAKTGDAIGQFHYEPTSDSGPPQFRPSWFEVSNAVASQMTVHLRFGLFAAFASAVGLALSGAIDLRLWLTRRRTRAQSSYESAETPSSLRQQQ
jgi:tRNA A-37 threonylcarbamoyl transferase component Bud32